MNWRYFLTWMGGILFGLFISSCNEEHPSILLSPGAARPTNKILLEIGYAPDLDVHSFGRRSVQEGNLWPGGRWNEYIYLKFKDERNAIELRDRLLRAFPEDERYKMREDKK
jgi:hypothetical protein